MLIDGRLVAVGAVAVGLTVTWLRRRGQQRRAIAAARQRGGHASAQLLPRGRPLHSKPDEVSLVSYNILCERYANSRRLPHVFAQVRADSAPLPLPAGVALAPKPCLPQGATLSCASCWFLGHAQTACLPCLAQLCSCFSRLDAPLRAQYLDPDYRWQRLQAELASFGADLVALQEVTVDRCAR